ncbi:hypothetical protein [Pseudomonas poae]|uniref:hypothetical protein n=1 Tax=Pseudomonas poae TaxID=200451 RepID=UPI00034AA970|nr:hypothetical protein [Pseudomonas poae]KRP52252.1 hypothetical protein TU75_08650 [Pseudomonas poae]MBC3197657.1 hypothetical protein [Pseudomonas poae]
MASLFIGALGQLWAAVAWCTSNLRGMNRLASGQAMAKSMSKCFKGARIVAGNRHSLACP